MSSSMRSGREKSIASLARANSRAFPSQRGGRLVALVQRDVVRPGRVGGEVGSLAKAVFHRGRLPTSWDVLGRPRIRSIVCNTENWL